MDTPCETPHKLGILYGIRTHDLRLERATFSASKLTGYKLGTVDGNQTRRILIDSQLSPSGDLYGINFGGLKGSRTPPSGVTGQYTNRYIMRPNLVEPVGLEPTMPFGRKIYSLLGLPIFLQLHDWKSIAESNRSSQDENLMS